MQSVPGTFNLFRLNQLDLGTQAMSVGKLNHLASIGDTANQGALQASVTEDKQRREDL
tara:strand:- start:55 stop:228 length:174 start_codon:yes stop_codon:yes gene_type:complete